LTICGQYLSILTLSCPKANGEWKKLTMEITNTGYTSEEKNIGGAGKLLIDIGTTGTCRLEPVSTIYTPDGNSYISLGGFQIGTATFGSDRALWVFTPNMSTNNLEETHWRGLKFEIVSDTNYKALCSYNISYSRENDTTNNYVWIGGGRISIDILGRILTVNKGIPEETKEAMIGSKRVTLGRFGNYWGIAIYSRFTSCAQSTINPQLANSIILQNSSSYTRTVLTTTFDPLVPCPDGIQIWLQNTSDTATNQIYFEVSTNGGTTWTDIVPDISSPSGSTVTILPDKEFGTDILLTVSPWSEFFEGSPKFNENWGQEVPTTHIFTVKNISDNSAIQTITVNIDSV